MDNEFSGMLSYCQALTFNNNREWFHQHHDAYVEAKESFESLVEIIKFKYLDAIPDIGLPLFPVDVSALCYRIPRDARSLGGKPPYNPSFRAYFAPDRHSWKPESYFLKIGIDEAFIGTALFLNTTAQVYKAREFFSLHTLQVQDALPRGKGFVLSGDKLKKMPAMYPEDHPLGDFLKMKFWQITYEFDDSEMTGFDSFGDQCMEVCRQMEKLRRLFINAYDFSAEA